jgi:HAD superfamily hydrolase (TIGR01490 family)
MEKIDNSQKKTAAFFDLDLTITRHDSFRAFLFNQYIKKYYYWPYLPILFIGGILRKLRFISLKTFKEISLIAYRKSKKKDISREGKLFCEKYMTSMLRQSVVQAIKFHRDKGHLLFIATSSPDIYVEYIASYLNFTGYICTKLKYKNDRFIDKIAGKDCLGGEKARQVKIISEKYKINLKKSFAYSDHESDLPLLKIVGYPVAVDPTAKLEKIASVKNWKILKK